MGKTLYEFKFGVLLVCFSMSLTHTYYCVLNSCGAMLPTNNGMRYKITYAVMTSSSL